MNGRFMKQFLCLILALGILGCKQKTSNTVKPVSTVEHVVLFWAQDSISADILDSIKENSAQLDTIPGIITLSMGEAIPSERPIVDASFTLGLIFSFPDKATMDAYLIHPGHKDFVAKWIKPNVKKLVVYDIQK